MYFLSQEHQKNGNEKYLKLISKINVFALVINRYRVQKV
jgi:hypothetical protein